MKYRVTARYHVWIDKTVEADNEDQAADKAIDEISGQLRGMDGYVDRDLEDSSVEELP